MKTAAKVLSGREGDLPEGLSLTSAAIFNFALMTCVDADATFSMSLLSENRQSTTEENIKKLIVVPIVISDVRTCKPK